MTPQKKLIASTDPGFLQWHLLNENKAMAKYALAAGMHVPALLLQELQDLDFKLSAPETAADAAEQTTTATAEVVANDSKRLGQIHNHLSKIVAPARPGSLLLLANEAEKGGLIRSLGPVPLIRQMMLVAGLSLAAMILVSLTEPVNGKPDSFSLLKSHGYELFLNELFLLTAAAVGASFFALFQANRYIKEGTYDQRYEASYWIRFVLGLMAGIIMANLIPIEGTEKSLESLHGMEKPLLAMLGGFSASVVYRILNRLISAVESLVQADVQSQIATREQQLKLKLQEQSLEQRGRMAAKLQLLQQKFQEQENSAELVNELNRLQNELFSSEGFLVEEPLAAAAEEKQGSAA